MHLIFVLYFYYKALAIFSLTARIRKYSTSSRQLLYSMMLQQLNGLSFGRHQRPSPITLGYFGSFKHKRVCQLRFLSTSWRSALRYFHCCPLFFKLVTVMRSKHKIVVTGSLFIQASLRKLLSSSRNWILFGTRYVYTMLICDILYTCSVILFAYSYPRTDFIRCWPSFVVSSRTHFAIIYSHFIHANFIFILFDPCEWIISN